MTTDQVLDYLNELLKLDPEAISGIFTTYNEVNDDVAEHAHAVVGYDNFMGPLGVINGILDMTGNELIAAVINEDVDEYDVCRRITEFIRADSVPKTESIVNGV